MKIKQKIKQFVIAYELLVEYFTNEKYRVPDFLYKDLVQLVVFLDLQNINIHTFLIANFRLFEGHNSTKYPFVRYLLNNSISIRFYETHHQLHGDKVGIVNYSRVLSIIKDMKADSKVWFTLSKYTLSERSEIFLPRASDTFKHYILIKYPELKFNGNFVKYQTLESVLEVVSFDMLESIFENTKL